MFLLNPLLSLLTSNALLISPLRFTTACYTRFRNCVPAHEPPMTSHETDRRHLERQILYARPIIILLSILAILEWPLSPESHRSRVFLFGYLFYSLALIVIDFVINSRREWTPPLAIDFALIIVLIYLSPFAVPVW